MPGRTPLRREAAGILIAILAVLVLAADQLAKLAVIRNLPYGKPIRVLGDVLIFQYVRNSGAAFSIGEDVTWVFTIALAVVAIVIVWLAIARVRSRTWAIVLGLLLGGVLGNLGDRLFRAPGFAVGRVVDVISTPWMMPAIYNVADIFIVCGMIAVAVLVLAGVRLDGTREPRRAPGEVAQPDPDAERAAASDPAPSSVEGAGADRDPLFPVGDAGAGAPADDPDDPGPVR